MAACKGKKMLKTLKRQNQAFKSYKKTLFMLPVYLIQHAQACLLMQSLITWSGGTLFPWDSLQRGRVAETPGVPYPSWVATLSLMTPVRQSSACCLGLTSPQWITNDKVQSCSSPTGSSTLPSHNLHVHLLQGPQRISYWLVPLFINPVFMAPKQNIFLPLFAS